MVRKAAAVLLMLAVMAMAPSVASAAVYTYAPVPNDLYNLDHYKWYTWGVDWTHQGETITEAVLTIEDIYDWRYEEGDSLYMHLLDDPALGVTIGADNQGGLNYFEGNGFWIDTWSDPFGDAQHKVTLTYSMKDLGLLDEFATYFSDGRGGFGFDPDCHYYNDNVYLEVTTEVIPEPASLSLLGLGLLGAAALRRRKQ